MHWSIDGHIKSPEVHDAKAKGSSLIRYDAVTGAGRIDDKKNGNSYCWDTRFALYADIPCSQSRIAPSLSGESRRHSRSLPAFVSF